MMVKFLLKTIPPSPQSEVRGRLCIRMQWQLEGGGYGGHTFPKFY